MLRRRVINRLQHEVLRTLGRLRFATESQLSYWTGVSISAISKALSRLLAAAYVQVEKSRPAIWKLSAAGAALVRIPLPSGGRPASWSVMAHACHVNAVEILLRETTHKDFRFLPRIELLRQGFNPAFGEHAGISNNQSIFVLVDDYAMQSDRITRSFTRRHAPNRKYWPDPAGRVWGEVAQSYLVACTDPIQAETHRTYIAQERLPAEVVHVEALWRT
jgi:DNA-binding transcriptional ArsR family regulator